MMEHGFGFDFLSLIKYEDEEDAGHRWTETRHFFLFLLLFFSPLS